MKTLTAVFLSPTALVMGLNLAGVEVSWWWAIGGTAGVIGAFLGWGMWLVCYRNLPT